MLLAFCAQHRFQDRVISVTDAFQKMDHFYWSLQAWLMYRFDLLSAFSTLFLTLLALYTGVSPGLTAFLLVAASRCMLYVTSFSISRLTESYSCQLYAFIMQAIWAAANGFCLCGKSG